MESILSLVGGETVNCRLSKSYLGTYYCKGAVGKKGDKILVLGS